MNAKQKELYLLLLKEGNYCRTRMNNNRESVYVVYTGKQEPIKYFPRPVGDALKNFFKRNSTNAYTLNLSKVRSVDGRSFIKKTYKKLKHAKPKEAQAAG